MSSLMKKIGFALGGALLTAPSPVYAGGAVSVQVDTTQPKAKKSRRGGKSLKALSARLNTHVADYNALKAKVNQIEAGAHHNTSLQSLADALKPAFDAVTGLKTTMESNCDAYTQHVQGLQVAAQQRELELQQAVVNQELAPYDRATKVQEIYQHMIGQDHDMLRLWDDCNSSQTTYTAAKASLEANIKRNLLRTEEQDREFMTGIVSSETSGLRDDVAGLEDSVSGLQTEVNKPKGNKVTVTPTIGVEYHDATAIVVGAEASYGAFFLQGGAFIGDEASHKIDGTSTGPTTTDIGKGYKTSSSSSETGSDSTDYHAFAGVGLAARGQEGKLSGSIGASANAYFGTQTTERTNTRKSQLQNEAGDNVGDAHEVSASETSESEAYSFVPQLNVEGCFNSICLDAHLGYDVSRDVDHAADAVVAGAKLGFKF